MNLDKLLGWRKAIIAVCAMVLTIVGLFSPFVANQQDKILAALELGIPALIALMFILANVILALIRKEPIVIPEAPDLATRRRLRMAGPTSVVQSLIDTAQDVVSSPQGMFAYLKNAIWERFQYWIAMMASVNMTTIEAIAKFAEDFLNKHLTPQQCSDVQQILGLQQVVTSYNDIGNFNEFEKSYLLGTLSPVQMQTFMYAARKRVAIDIVHEYKWRASAEFELDGITPRSMDAKKQALVDFGFSHADIREVSWSGSTALFMGYGINFYEKAGLAQMYPDLRSKVKKLK